MFNVFFKSVQIYGVKKEYLTQNQRRWLSQFSAPLELPAFSTYKDNILAFKTDHCCFKIYHTHSVSVAEPVVYSTLLMTIN